MIPRVVFVVAVASAAGGLLLLSACSSSSTSNDTQPTPSCNDPSSPTDLSKCPSDPFAVNGANGSTKISKCAACDRYVAALMAKAEQLHCTLSPTPKCPDVLDQFEAQLKAKQPDLCIDSYIGETLSNCECRVNTYTSCEDFAAPDAGADSGPSRNCTIGVFQCGSDAGGGDALPDTSAFDDADAGGGG
jgi:hypothetical protein